MIINKIIFFLRKKEIIKSKENTKYNQKDTLQHPKHNKIKILLLPKTSFSETQILTLYYFNKVNIEKKRIDIFLKNIIKKSKMIHKIILDPNFNDINRIKQLNKIINLKYIIRVEKLSDKFEFYEFYTDAKITNTIMAIDQIYQLYSYIIPYIKNKHKHFWTIDTTVSYKIKTKDIGMIEKNLDTETFLKEEFNIEFIMNTFIKQISSMFETYDIEYIEKIKINTLVIFL